MGAPERARAGYRGHRAYVPAFVVVSGPPASGKTTLARALAPRLGLPLLTKDTLKDALMTVLPVPDVETSRLVGRAASVALLALAAEAGRGVLEALWHRSRALPALRALPGDVVEVFCRCDRPVAERRYRARAGTRHAGHFDAQRVPEELWNDELAQPVAGGWPVVEVDTTGPVDVDAVVRRVLAQAHPGTPTRAVDRRGVGAGRSGLPLTRDPGRPPSARLPTGRCQTPVPAQGEGRSAGTADSPSSAGEARWGCEGTTRTV